MFRCLLTLFEVSLQLSEYIEVTKSGACSYVVDSWCRLLLCSLLSRLLLLLDILECTRVREDDTLGVLYKLDYHEWELLALLSLRTILLNEVLWSSEALTTFVQCDDCTLVHSLGNLTCVDATWCVDSLVCIPWILLQLLVTERETTVLLVYLENDNVDVGTCLSEL